MNRLKIFFLVIFLVAFGVFSFSYQNDKVDQLEVLSQKTPIKTQPIQRFPSSNGEPDRQKNVKKLEITRPPQRERHNEFVQKDVSYKWLDGVVAVSKTDPALQGIRIESSLGHFVIIDEADLPEGVKAFAVLERSNRGTKAIFTGVMKSITHEALEVSQITSECPCIVEASYPAIKSHLLRPNPDTSLSEFQNCLSETSYFKHLEWEILASPRSSR
jgi:ribosomal protein L14E/L6E/L27E